MYDELIANLRNCAEVNSLSRYKRDLMKQAADAIEELQKALNDAHNEGYDVGYWAGRRDYEPKWIPVTERLPKLYKQCDVLCYYDGVVVVGYYTDDEVGWHDLHSYKIYPTHWLPLPEPPKGD